MVIFVSVFEDDEVGSCGLKQVTTVHDFRAVDVLQLDDLVLAFADGEQECLASIFLGFALKCILDI